MRRFTWDGSSQLESHLARTTQAIADGVREIIPARKFDALLLGGGYGRGEGSVLKTESGDQPYNDLEFYVAVKGSSLLNQRRYATRLHALAEALSPGAQVEIEFKIVSLAELRRSPPSMFYYDLVMGHRRLVGDKQVLAGCNHLRDARRLPLSEATRLLMNRCTGLLFAREKLRAPQFIDADADFVARNIAKAELALGDAVLTTFGQYHWSCLERRKRLANLHVVEHLPWLGQLRRHHLAGVEFKLHPRRSTEPADVLWHRFRSVSRLALQVWLWLEGRRLHRPFRSARQYAADRANKFPETKPWRNRLLNVKVFGPRAFFGRHSRRHPREQVLNALCKSLWRTDGNNHLAWLPAEELEQYRALWKQVQ
jgi:hypothetical protein